MHQYGMNKRTTKTFKEKYHGFAGWDKIEETYYNGCHDADDQAIFLTCFKTMGRAMECGELKLSNFDLDKDPDQIFVKGMKLEKQKDVIYLEDKDGNPLLNEQGKKKFVFESRKSTRSFYIPKFEPLSDEFAEMITDKRTALKEYNEKHDTEFSDLYLLQSDNGEKWKYHQMYYKVCKIGVPEEGFGGNGWCHRKGEWWMHRIRSEKCCQLVVDYKFDLFKLQKYGSWSTPDMALEYMDMTPEQTKVDKVPEKWWR